MSYGILIPNITSLTSTPEVFRGARLLRIVQARDWNGSQSVPEFNSASGFFYARSNVNAAATPRMIFDNSSKVFSWSVGGSGAVNDTNWSRNFDVFFFASGAV
jgi:hypothetical protein